MKNKKSLVAKGKVPKSFGNKSPIRISLCMGKIIDGLHADFIVIKEGKDRGSLITLSLNGDPIAFFDMAWSERIHPEDDLLDVRAKLLSQIEPKK